MYYLDANAFIYPALYEGPKAHGAANLLEQVVENRAGGATAALTIDEVVYILSREGERDTAIDLGRRILEFPNLRILAIEGVHVLRALSAMESHPRLSPRDAIHYATMREHGIHAIVSDDQDFADLPDISIHSLESFAGG